MLSHTISPGCAQAETSAASLGELGAHLGALGDDGRDLAEGAEQEIAEGERVGGAALDLGRRVQLRDFRVGVLLFLLLDLIGVHVDLHRRIVCASFRRSDSCGHTHTHTYTHVSDWPVAG